MIPVKPLVEAAEIRIRMHVRETPLEHSAVLSGLTGATVYLKLENLQRTGSFKVRGAFNRLLSLTEQERTSGIVAASSGNHGAAVALGMNALGLSGIIFVPESASRAKVEKIRQLGADVRAAGDDSGATELFARAYAADRRMTYISPYNDEAVIAGQGTIGAEILRQLPSVDAVVASIGGGGLISGVAGYLKSVKPDVFALGVSARNSMAMQESIRAGLVIETEHLPTLSDGTAGGIEPGAITFELCRSLVDEFIDVGEDGIRSALRLFIESHAMLCEGAAALAIAGLLAAKERLRGKTVAVLICGANIAADKLKEAL
ncbi:MAG TPA: threonine/serine dehydratase [Candidatus Eremiobacteraceae bacterium]